jgi:hypothetical protein
MHLGRGQACLAALRASLAYLLGAHGTTDCPAPVHAKGNTSQLHSTVSYSIASQTTSSNAVVLEHAAVSLPELR